MLPNKQMKTTLFITNIKSKAKNKTINCIPTTSLIVKM